MTDVNAALVHILKRVEELEARVRYLEDQIQHHHGNVKGITDARREEQGG